MKMTLPARFDVTVNGDLPFEGDLLIPAVARVLKLMDQNEDLRSMTVQDGPMDADFVVARNEDLFATVYLRQQAYGGPEEGGWWYETGGVVQVDDLSRLSYDEAVRFIHDLKAEYEEGQDMMRDYYSVNAEGLYEVHIGTEPGEDYPKYRPHYE